MVENEKGGGMTREQILEILIILSAIESWSFAEKHMLPDYLHERLADIIEVLSKEILK